MPLVLLCLPFCVPVALARLEGAESTVDGLVSTARSINSLCQMDPAWYPWL